MRSTSPAERRSNPYGELAAVATLTALVIGAHAASPVDLRLGNWSLARPGAALRMHLPTQSLPPASPPATRQDAHSKVRSEAANDRELGADVPTASPHSDAVANERPTVDRRPQRILLFGDSMVPVIAPRLGDYCAHNGHELFPVVWHGGTIMIWGWQPRLNQLITEFQPTFVFAALGSMELRTRDVELRRAYVAMIVRKVGERHFAWIGPPNWRDDTGINALLLAELGRTRFFSSASLDLQRKNDGIHPSEEGGTKWVDHFASWLGSESAHPIALARPARRAPPVAARVYHDVPEIPGSPGRFWPFQVPAEKRPEN